MHQNQPILYISLRSPFARRIRLALHRLGVSFELKTLDVFKENAELLAANPLGMVPTLVTSHGAISDSANILEYLDSTHTGIWPDDTRAAINARQASVWAAGIMQSLVLYFQEEKMHEVPSLMWLKDHTDSMETTLAFLANAPDAVWFSNATGSDGLTQAAWDLCVALEYMDVRVPSLDWRTKYPSFVSLLASARKNAFFCETTPPV